MPNYRGYSGRIPARGNNRVADHIQLCPLRIRNGTGIRSVKHGQSTDRVSTGFAMTMMTVLFAVPIIGFVLAFVFLFTEARRSLSAFVLLVPLFGVASAVLGPPKVAHFLEDMEFHLTDGGMLLVVPIFALGGCALGAALALGINRFVGVLRRRMSKA